MLLCCFFSPFFSLFTEQGLEVPNTTTIRLRPHSQSSSERTSSYRFSMANLEETHEAELDAILGELSLLEQHAKSPNANETDNKTMNNLQRNATIMSPVPNERNGRTHSRSNSTISGVTNSSISISSESGNGSGSDSSGAMRESRTESPDNDSAFSDTVSLLSSESSASSNISNLTGNVHGKNILSMNMNLLQVSFCPFLLFSNQSINLRGNHFNKSMFVFAIPQTYSVIALKRPKSIWHCKS